MNPATLGSGEILVGLLLIALPVIGIGTIIWRLADRTRGLQASVESSVEKSTAAAAGVAKVESSLTALRDDIHRDYVRTDSLEKVEDRLTKRIGELDHHVRGVPMAVVGLLREAPQPTTTRRRPQP